MKQAFPGSYCQDGGHVRIFQYNSTSHIFSITNPLDFSDLFTPIHSFLLIMTASAPVNSGYLQASDPSKPSSGAAVPFREIVPPPGHPRIAGIEHHSAQSWCDSRRQIEAPAWLINRLDAKNLEKPYKGFTTDGKVREGVYHYAEDEGAPTEQVAEKVEALLEILSEEDKKAVQFGSVTDDEFRLWSNPELYMNPGMQFAPHP
jgi:hypothetical protein